jgi:hypothetical protein
MSVGAAPEYWLQRAVVFEPNSQLIPLKHPRCPVDGPSLPTASEYSPKYLRALRCPGSSPRSGPLKLVVWAHDSTFTSVSL